MRCRAVEHAVTSRIDCFVAIADKLFWVRRTAHAGSRLPDGPVAPHSWVTHGRVIPRYRRIFGSTATPRMQLRIMDAPVRVHAAEDAF